MTHRRRGERGFTLVEMTVVLLLFAVVLAIVYPNLPGLFGRGAPRDTVRRLTEALTQARAEAIAARRSIRFSLGRDGRSWRIGEGKGETAAGAALTLAGAPLAGGPAIVFFPDGSSTGGRITVGDAATGRVIGVGWLTGKIADVTGLPP